MGHRQKGKSRKRLSSWHRGLNRDRQYTAAARIFTGLAPTGADPTQAAPQLVLRGKARANRGDAT